MVSSASYNAHVKVLSVVGYDANSGALYTLSVTSTGKVVIPAGSAAGLEGALPLTAGLNWPCPGETTCSLPSLDQLAAALAS